MTPILRTADLGDVAPEKRLITSVVCLWKPFPRPTPSCEREQLTSPGPCQERWTGNSLTAPQAWWEGVVLPVSWPHSAETGPLDQQGVRRDPGKSKHLLTCQQGTWVRNHTATHPCAPALDQPGWAEKGKGDMASLMWTQEAHQHHLRYKLVPFKDK